MATLPTAVRFFHPGLTKVFYVPAVSTKTAPTRIEIGAGTDLSRDVADWAGWSVSSEQIDTPDLGTRFTSKIGGRTTSPDSSITFYADRAGADVRTVLPRDTVGFILIADGGDVAANKADLFPVTVIGVPKERPMAGSAGRLMVQFSITAEPTENVPMPA